MSITISKSFKFDAGHRALGFNYKKEETIHGHTWNMDVVIKTDLASLDSKKIIFDTNELKKIVKPIVDEFDHSFIIWNQDPMMSDLKLLCDKFNLSEKLCILDINPTLEGLAEYFFHRIKDQIKIENVSLKEVSLRAATTLYASYSQ